MILPHHPDRPEWPGLAIGYWRVNDPLERRYATRPDVPFRPQDFVDPSWDATERDLVIAYLERGRVKDSWRGSSSCRICGCRNGSTCLTDGTYTWPQGFAHYLRQHQVRPPAWLVLPR